MTNSARNSYLLNEEPGTPESKIDEKSPYFRLQPRAQPLASLLEPP